MMRSAGPGRLIAFAELASGGRLAPSR
jgi:hypothetical protein